MTRPFIRKDMVPLAKELGVTDGESRMVEIEKSTWDELYSLERRRNPDPNMKAVVNSILNAWLCKV